jgi:hypothetical protein
LRIGAAPEAAVLGVAPPKGLAHGSSVGLRAPALRADAGQLRAPPDRVADHASNTLQPTQHIQTKGTPPWPRPLSTVSFADDLTVAIDEQGSGRRVLLLHGGGGPQTVARLSAALSDESNVISPTHPGFNLTHARTGMTGSTTLP